MLHSGAGREPTIEIIHTVYYFTESTPVLSHLNRVCTQNIQIGMWYQAPARIQLKSHESKIVNSCTPCSVSKIL